MKMENRMKAMLIVEMCGSQRTCKTCPLCGTGCKMNTEADVERLYNIAFPQKQKKQENEQKDELAELRQIVKEQERELLDVYAENRRITEALWAARDMLRDATETLETIGNGGEL